MSLQPVQLDTLDWQDIVTAIRTRIYPDSNGKWTFQAPVDPGVTLLELFAWLLDQRIYWMNQTPASLVLAVMSLLGESPNPAKAAVTVLQLADSALPARQFPVASAGTLMRLGDTNPPILFTTDQSLTVLPLKGISVTVNGVDMSNDLAQGQPVAVLSPGQQSSELRFLLHLSQSIPSSLAGNFFSLMFQFQVPADEYPQWSPSAVAGIVPAASLTWSYTSSSSGASAVFAATQVDDGTQGFRRSGVVRLPFPSDWKAEPAGSDSSATTYAIVLDISNASFTYAPQLIQVQGNEVLAQHSWPRSIQPSTANWLPLPGNIISVQPTPDTPSWQEYPPIEDSVQVSITAQGGTPVEWQRVLTLALAGPTDTDFIVDRARAQIRFGDGLTGRLPIPAPTTSDPASSATTFTVTYNAGGGTAGNVGEGLSWEAVPPVPGGPSPQFTATNLAEGSGGADTETLLQAQQRVQEELNLPIRAVTAADFENLAISTPGVTLRRAYAAIGYHPNFPCATVPGAITVFIVPYAPRVQTDGTVPTSSFVAVPQPDPGALAAALARLQAGKILGGQIFVCPPTYRPVWLRIQVAVDRTLSAALRSSVLTGLQTYLDPLVGGDEGGGWPFGNPLRPSGLLKVAQEILGEKGDVLSVGVRIDGMTSFENCQDTTIQPYELVRLVHVDLATQRRPAQSAGLR